MHSAMGCGVTKIYNDFFRMVKSKDTSARIAGWDVSDSPAAMEHKEHLLHSHKVNCAMPLLTPH